MADTTTEPNTTAADATNLADDFFFKFQLTKIIWGIVLVESVASRSSYWAAWNVLFVPNLP